MRSRGLVVAIAIVLAIVAAAAVILYTNQVRQQALSDEATVVVISTQDIAAGTKLDPLVEKGVFTPINIPNGALVDGAVTSLGDLAGETTTSPILAREQIPASRLSSGQAEFSQVGVTDNHVGVAITLGGERAGAGTVQLGDSVVVYVTFGKDTIVQKETLDKILTPAQIQKFIEAQKGSPSNVAQLPAFQLGADFTAAIVPAARVIQISNPAVDEQGRTQAGDVTLMLDLEPGDAESVIFSMERASVWLGLLPPKNKEGYVSTAAILGPQLDRLVGKA